MKSVNLWLNKAVAYLCDAEAAIKTMKAAIKLVSFVLDKID